MEVDLESFFAMVSMETLANIHADLKKIVDQKGLTDDDQLMVTHVHLCIREVEESITEKFANVYKRTTTKTI